MTDRNAGGRPTPAGNRIALIFGLLIAMLGAHPLPAFAQFLIPGFELVHNAPAGTTLISPDLRDAATVWADMIDGAQHDIALEQFYVAGKKGEALDPVIAALEAAGQRGVHIRFLMEKKGEGMSNPDTIARLKAIPNLTFRTLAWADVAGSGIIHAKFCIVDGREAYVGSQNFDWRSLSQIDETGLRITQPHMVGQLHAIFDHDWQAQERVAAGKSIPPLRRYDYAPTAGYALLVASPNTYDPVGIGDSQEMLVRLIGAAKRDIVIEVMDYSTTAFGGGAYHVIDDAIRAAAKRGVHVRLIIADWALTDQRLPGLTSLAAVPNVDIRVASIPQPDSGPIPYARVVHTKVMTIDNATAWIGTSNWEGGYLDTSRNVEVVLNDAAMANRLRALEDRLWNSDYAAPFAVARTRPPVHLGG